MGDITGVEEYESMTRSERIRKDIYPKLFDWIESDFKEQLRDNLSKTLDKKKPRGNKLKEIYKERAALLRDFAQVLNIFWEDEKAVYWNSRLKSTIESTDKKSIVNCLGEENQGYVSSHLVGAISPLVLVRLIENVRPDLEYDKKQLFSTEVMDVQGKIDMIFDFGTTNRDGKSIIRHVQIKGDKSCTVTAENVDPAALKSSYLGGAFSRKDAEIMIRYGNDYCYKKKAVPIFIVICVPSLDSEVVNNLFGVLEIYDEEERNHFLNGFIEDANRVKLFPPRKKT